MEINMDDELNALLIEVSNGNAEAYAYLFKIAKIARVWDDFIDQDNKISPESMDEALSDLAFDFSQNKFFKKNRQALEAFHFLAWNAWKDSETWRGNENKAKGLAAWFLRDFFNEIDVLVAWLVGGL